MSPPQSRSLPGPPLRTALAALAAAATLGAVAAPASAEIVVLAGGRTLSVQAHREDGDSLVLTLRAGGEVVCPRSLVVEIVPDEVPYPEAASAPAATELVPARAPTDGPFQHLIEAAAERHGVDARLLNAVIRVESNFEHRARSRRGAMGLMQLMPTTARRYAVTNPYDPQSNVDAGARHLRALLDRFDLSLALAAYNAGEGAVRRFGGIPPYAETRDYVRRVLRLVAPAR